MDIRKKEKRQIRNDNRQYRGTQQPCDEKSSIKGKQIDDDKAENLKHIFY